MKPILHPMVKLAVLPLTFTIIFSSTGYPQKISGKIFHDIYANGVEGTETVGDANNPGISGVTIRLFSDNGNGTFDGSDNTMVTNGNVTTDATGAYSIPSSTTTLANGTYWLVVYSQTISCGTYNTGYSSADTWMEQTYGSGGTWGGNLRANGSGGTETMTSDGRCFGGKTADKSDLISNTNTPTSAQIVLAEHVVKITISGSSISNVNMGFSFNAVTNTADDDQLAYNNKWAQGTLRQFINNANAISGANTMVFVPASATNAGSGSNKWWSITLTAALTKIMDDNTVIDGKAYSYLNGSVLDYNTGTAPNAPTGKVGAGADGREGTGDEATLPAYYCPELEINGNHKTSGGDGIIELANTLWNVSVDGFGCYRVAFYNNPDGDACGIYTSKDATGVNSPTIIQECFFGVRANGNAPADAEKSNIGVCIPNLSYGTVSKCYFDWQLYTGMFVAGTCTAEYNAVLNSGTAAYDCGDGITTEDHMGTGTQIVNAKYVQYNYIQYSASYGIECWNIPGVAYIKNNTIMNSGVQGTCDGSGIYNEDSGIRLFGDNNQVFYNLIKNNPGSGIVVVNQSTSNSINNKISKNVIYHNGRLSLDYQPFNSVRNPNGNGVTANDGVFGGGVNKSMDYPVFTAVSMNGTSMYVKGYVGSAPNQSAFGNATVEVYKADDDGNNNGEVVAGDGLSKSHGEGRYYLASITTDASGNFESTITIDTTIVSPGDALTGTATLLNNTSEFGVTYLTPYTLLDVVMGNFTATDNNEDVLLQWSTLREINNGYFTVEKSSDAVNWQPVAVIRSSDANSSTTKQYNATDDKPYNGSNYYRIKITDANNKSEYSKTIHITHKSHTTQNVYPNPFNSNVKIQVYSSRVQTITIYVADVTGRIVKQYQKSLKNGQNNFTLDNMESLKAGTYLIQARNEDLSFSERLVKL